MEEETVGTSHVTDLESTSNLLGETLGLWTWKRQGVYPDGKTQTWNTTYMVSREQ